MKLQVTSCLVLIELLPGSCPPLPSSIGEVSPGVSTEVCDGASSGFEEAICSTFFSKTFHNFDIVFCSFWL